MRRIAVLVAVVAVAAVCSAPASAVHHHAPSAGAVGIGDPLFPTRGNGGYDALHYNLSLRQVVGEDTFSDIERSWVRKYEEESVSTEQFIAHVNQVSHRNLTSFLRHWLYDDTVPPMPGHPDWTAAPVTPAATAAAARSSAFPSARALELGIYKR